jgi:protein CpxP
MSLVSLGGHRGSMWSLTRYDAFSEDLRKTPFEHKEKQMSPEKLDAVAIELKRFGQELNLSDSQKEQLKAHLADKYAKLQEFQRQNPNISRNDLVKKIASVRGTLREQVVRFLTPQQLEKWDAEVLKAKEFLGHSIAA